ncbi:MAG: hypothetical protein A2506_07910 [Elusimicrobia bacterium RIFOXYD12_FULL_66_9]|nr:MAG: hypothetical protein A2506_07910 [Elusimicrobia bacterium RIFOXYD12_FULL_66_9]
MITRKTPESATLIDLRDKALGLRESVNGTRARLYNQRETLRRLRAELAELNELARTGVPVAKEAALDSARAAATSLPAGVRRRGASASRLLPYAALAVFAIASQVPDRRPVPLPEVSAPAQLMRAEPEPSPVADDDRGDEAIALVHAWRVPGDDRPVIERVQQASELPGARPAWIVERTGEATYRVSFRPEQNGSSLEFDVDIDERRVDPSPDTAERLAPHLTARR